MKLITAFILLLTLTTVSAQTSGTSGTSNNGVGGTTGATNNTIGTPAGSGMMNTGNCTDVNGKTISSTHSDFANCIKARSRR